MSAMSIRLQRGINRYYIYLITQVIGNNTLLAQIAQIREFGPRPLKVWSFLFLLLFHARAVNTLTTWYQPL